MKSPCFLDQPAQLHLAGSLFQGRQNPLQLGIVSSEPHQAWRAFWIDWFPLQTRGSQSSSTRGPQCRLLQCSQHCNDGAPVPPSERCG